ncbi:SGNH/GDSL hydrolase family protein [Mycobacterium sp. NPDC051804]|uniref:SGNH/GDSL hydrolase family protein n=1 Tax=Mycobacterium sp. NPDC051804 TaxID=3364295 RepID=UPI0037AA58E5
MKRVTRDRPSGYTVYLVAASIIIVVLASAIWVRTGHGAPSHGSIETSYPSVPLAKVPRSTALFVGDEFTAGYGGIGRNAYPRIVCNNMQFVCNVDASAGTRLVSTSDAAADSALIDRLATDQKLYSADVLIVDAGRNDLDQPVPVYADALSQYLTRAAGSWPDAKIVVVAPTFLSPEPAEIYTSRLQAIQDAAASVGGIVVDPVSEGWYQGVDVASLLLPDSAHPNQAGHHHIADKLQQSLASHGITPRGDSR